MTVPSLPAPVRPLSVVHRGMVSVLGFVIHPALVGEAEARARVIRLLYPGVQVRKWRENYLVLLATPARTWTASTLGTPLVPVWMGRAYVPSAAPFTAREVESLLPTLENGPEGKLILVQDGKALILQTDKLEQVDPASWLNLAGARLVQVESLGTEPLPVAVMEKPKSSLKEIIGTVPGVAKAKISFVSSALREREWGANHAETGGNPGHEGSGLSSARTPANVFVFLLVLTGLAVMRDLIFTNPPKLQNVYLLLKNWVLVALMVMVIVLLVSLVVLIFLLVWNLVVAGLKKLWELLRQKGKKKKPLNYSRYFGTGRPVRDVGAENDFARVSLLFWWFIVFAFAAGIFISLQDNLSEREWGLVGLAFLVPTVVFLSIFLIQSITSGRRPDPSANSSNWAGTTAVAGQQGVEKGLTGRLGFLFKAVSNPFRWISAAWRSLRDNLGLSKDKKNGMTRHITEPRNGWLVDFLGQFTAMSWLVSRQRVRYMRNMMDLFERGNFHEALRHALPLTDKPDDPGAPPAFSLDFFRPRDLVQLFPKGTSSPGRNYLGPDLFNHLKEMYRQAFNSLDKAGKTEEAVFLLADLLDSPEEAVSYLEGLGLRAYSAQWDLLPPGVVARQLLKRKILLTQAAELAEGRGLNPPLVIRQWCLAGDFERAVAIARLTSSFAAAVALLEKRKQPEADRLRCLWAHSLASAGDWAGAVDVAWPWLISSGLLPCSIPSDGPFPDLPLWMEKAVAAGGPGAGHVLALLVGFVSEGGYPALRDRVRHVLLGDPATGFQQRLAFAQTLVSVSRNSRIRGLFARQILKALVADSAHRPMPNTFFQIQERLLGLAGGSLMRYGAALYRKPASQPLETLVEPYRTVFTPEHRGVLPVLDAVWLAGERLLVALGEAGMRLMDTMGKVLASFDEPAHALVPSDNGLRVIAVADRGQIKRLSRLDVGSMTASFWCDAPIRCHAANFDSQTWFVALEDELVALDTQADNLRFLWRAHGMDFDTPDGFGAGFTKLVREGQALWGLRGQPGKESSWKWSYPDLVLRNRNLPMRSESFEEVLRGQGVGAIREVRFNYDSANNWPIIWSVTHSPMDDPGNDVKKSISLLFCFPASQRSFFQVFYTSLIPDMVLEHAEIQGVWNAFILRDTSEENTRVICLVHAQGKLVTVVCLKNSQGTRCRFSREELVITDYLGRFISVRLADGAITFLRVL